MFSFLFPAKHEGWKAAKLNVSKIFKTKSSHFCLHLKKGFLNVLKSSATQEHKRVFERMWLGFLNYKVSRLDGHFLLCNVLCIVSR